MLNSVLKHLRLHFGPLRANDRVTNRQLSLLYYSLLTAILIFTGLQINALLSVPGRIYLAADMMALVVMGIAFVFLRKGRSRIAARIFVFGIFVVLVYITLVVEQTVRSSAVVGYFAIIPMTTLLLSKRSTNIVIGLICLTFFVVYLGNQQAWLNPNVDVTFTFVDLLSVLVTLGIAVFFQRANTAVLFETAEEAQVTARELQESNAALNKNRALLEQAYRELESRVVERTAQLQAREQQYRTLFDNAPEAILVFDADHATLVDLNRESRELFGYDRKTFLSIDLEQVLFLDQTGGVSRTGWEICFTRTLQGEKPIFECLCQTGNGEVISCEVRLIHLPDPQRRLIRCSILDISERKQAEKSIKEAQEAMRQMQKLESLGILAGGIAHDFNNLLVAMLGQATVARVKLADEDHPAQRHINKMVVAAERAADLTRQMLAYSGRGQFVVQSLNLNELVLENMHLFKVSLPKNVRLNTDLDKHLGTIEADKGQMQQVIMNLLLNAADAIGEQEGEVLIKTRLVPRLPAVNGLQYGSLAATWPQPAFYIKMIVQDDGCGMDAEVLGKIFDPFFTTKQSGRGLGLAAVIGIVRGHEGHIYVESEASGGTTFELFFPQSSIRPTQALISSRPASRVPRLVHREATILIIDDEEDVRETVTDILAHEGLKVLTAADGREGVSLYQTYQNEIELVLLDLSMPGLSATQACSQLKQIKPDVRIILSSGYGKQETLSQFEENMLRGFIQKPYDFETLAQTVVQYLE